MAAPERQESVHRFHIGGTALRANSGFPEVCEFERLRHSPPWIHRPSFMSETQGAVEGVGTCIRLK